MKKKKKRKKGGGFFSFSFFSTEKKLSLRVRVFNLMSKVSYHMYKK